MKNIILILSFLTTVLGYSQIVNQSDFTNTNGRLRIKEKIFQLEKLDKEKVNVTTTIYLNESQLSTLTIEKLNEMIIISNNKLPYQLKNKFSYTPKELRIDFIDKEKEWKVWIDYSAQNDYGALKDGMCAIHFNEDGSFKKLIML